MSEYSEYREGGGARAEGLALPPAHTEGLTYVEGMMVVDVGRQLYASGEMFGLGLRREWDRMTAGENGEQTFAEAYSLYVLDPEALRRHHPDRYEFVKQHIFYGYEFSDPRPQEQDAVKFGYLDYDNQERQIEVTSNGAWVIATGQKIG